MPAALLTGADHLFELANAPFLQMVGGREVVGKTCLEAFPELASTGYPAVLDRVFQTGERYVAPDRHHVRGLQHHRASQRTPCARTLNRIDVAAAVKSRPWPISVNRPRAARVLACRSGREDPPQW